MSEPFEQELAKAAAQIAVDTAKDARDALGKIFGDAIAEFGAALGDQVRLWRYKNLTNILQKMKAINAERSVVAADLRALPFGDAVRTLEAASQEEDEDVQTLWARLLANATVASGAHVANKVHVDLLKSLSAADAALLELLWECERRNRFTSTQEIKLFNERMNNLAESRWRTFPPEARAIASHNLARLRCITFRPRPLNPGNLLAQLPRELNNDLFRKWSVIDPDALQKLLEQVGEIIFAAAGAKEYPTVNALPLTSHFGGPFPGSIAVAEMNHMLTPLGHSLMRACRLELSAKNK